MYGAIIGAATGLAGSVISGIKASKEKQEYQNKLAEDQRNAQARVDKYETMSPQASIAYQNAINQGVARFGDYIKMREGQDAVMGSNNAGNASIEAVKGLGSTVSEAAARAQEHNDAKAMQAQSSVDALRAESRNANLQQAQQNAQAGSNALQAGLGMSMADAQAHLATGRGLLESMFKKRV